PGFTQAPIDLQHLLARSLTPEKHQSRRARSFQTQLNPLRSTIDGATATEARIQDHSRSLKDALVCMAQFARLFDCTPRAADQKLLLPFDPEMRGVICEICQNGHQRPAGAGLAQALAERAVEVRNERRDQIGFPLEPKPV